MEIKKCRKTLNCTTQSTTSSTYKLIPNIWDSAYGPSQNVDVVAYHATATSASSVIKRPEEVAKAAQFRVKKSESRVRLLGNENGRKGKLATAAEMFALTPAFMVVEVKKDGGDTLEYNQFCSEELRPALRDIMWKTEKPQPA